MSQENATISAHEQRQLQHHLRARFAAYLKPGEAVHVAGERSADYSWLQVSLASADRREQLVIEAAMLRQEQEGEALSLTPLERFEGISDFLGEQLYGYFCNDRRAEFHSDWRVYADGPIRLRFRGQRSSPALEQAADALLEQRDGATGEA